MERVGIRSSRTVLSIDTSRDQNADLARGGTSTTITVSSAPRRAHGLARRPRTERFGMMNRRSTAPDF